MHFVRQTLMLLCLLFILAYRHHIQPQPGRFRLQPMNTCPGQWVALTDLAAGATLYQRGALGI
jgi:hypothetical protein